jgi:xylulose-5-phosphate/fructose-6-phosphate phosphoketolase
VADSIVDPAALIMPSNATYGRAINGQSFQTQALQTVGGWQYTSWYTNDAASSVMFGRRQVSGTLVGDWEGVNTGSKFVNGKGSWDAHNVIAFGIAKNDGSIHMSWDLHGHNIRYRRTAAGVATTGTGWGAAMFLPEQNHLGDGAVIGSATYPNFIPKPDGGLLLADLKLPDFRDYALDVVAPGALTGEATRAAGEFLRDVFRLNSDASNFRVFGPDETESNRLGAVFETTNRVFIGEQLETDRQLAADGRVMEVLSEHLCQGWLEGYLLTGRHGFFSCYEAFIHIVDSMFNQHAKWLNVAKDVPWRKPIASLTYLLTSHVWRQDHNGFSHQDPGFLDHVMNKKASVVRVYLPPDANTLLSVVDHCLRSRDYINVIVAGKQPAPQWLSRDAAAAHCKAGLGTWEWASNCGFDEPDVVMASAGDVPTMEALAAVKILREQFPELKVRFVNVVDLMTLQAPSQHPHGMDDAAFDAIFTTDKPVIFAFHGYPALIHRLTYRRRNHANFHVHGFQEEGTTTTPFDMAVLNELDRFHLAKAAVDRVGALAGRRAAFTEFVDVRLSGHRVYIREHGDDMTEIREWVWSGGNSPRL